MRARWHLNRGAFESGEDVTGIRRFVGLTQVRPAQAMGISAQTLRDWEQGRRRPEGRALALLRIAARRPRFNRENLPSVAWPGRVSDRRGRDTLPHSFEGWAGVVSRGRIAALVLVSYARTRRLRRTRVGTSEYGARDGQAGRPRDG
jgi:DNA-binding XRE family transcriptional regulator